MIVTSAFFFLFEIINRIEIMAIRNDTACESNWNHWFGVRIPTWWRTTDMVINLVHCTLNGDDGVIWKNFNALEARVFFFTRAA